MHILTQPPLRCVRFERYVQQPRLLLLLLRHHRFHLNGSFCCCCCFCCSNRWYTETVSTQSCHITFAHRERVYGPVAFISSNKMCNDDAFDANNSRTCSMINHWSPNRTARKKEENIIVVFWKSPIQKPRVVTNTLTSEQTHSIRCAKPWVRTKKSCSSQQEQQKRVQAERFQTFFSQVFAVETTTTKEQTRKKIVSHSSRSLAILNALVLSEFVFLFRFFFHSAAGAPCVACSPRIVIATNS